MTRAEVERRLIDEEEVLAAVASLLRTGTPLRHWPEALAPTLLRAITEDGLRLTEADKAFALRRHLFADHPVELSPPSRPCDPRQARRAERLRADLASLVPLRAGARCLDG